MTAALDYAAEDAATERTADAERDAREEAREERWHAAQAEREECSEEDRIARTDDADAAAIVIVFGRHLDAGDEAGAEQVYRNALAMARMGSKAHRKAANDLIRMYRERGNS